MAMKPFRGAKGKATPINMPPDAPAIGLIAGWVVHSTEFIPGVTDYYVSCIHTRQLPGMKPKVKVHPDVTHEFLVVPLNPNKNTSPKYPKNFAPLMPEIYRGQVTELSDAQAQIICEILAKAGADGILPLLRGSQQYVQFWHAYVSQTRAQILAGQKFVDLEHFKGVG